MQEEVDERSELEDRREGGEADLPENEEEFEEMEGFEDMEPDEDLEPVGEQSPNTREQFEEGSDEDDFLFEDE